MLKLLVKNSKSDLLLAFLQALQLLFSNYQFLIINKKSIINLKTLLLINSCLQAVMPNTAYRLFKSINILLYKDFFQLLLISKRALYS